LKWVRRPGLTRTAVQVPYPLHSKRARAEVLCAVNVFEKLGAARDLKWCRVLLRLIEGKIDKPVIPDN